jgi:hypothetical protein
MLSEDGGELLLGPPPRGTGKCTPSPGTRTSAGVRTRRGAAGRLEQDGGRAWRRADEGASIATPGGLAVDPCPELSHPVLQRAIVVRSRSPPRKRDFRLFGPGALPSSPHRLGRRAAGAALCSGFAGLNGGGGIRTLGPACRRPTVFKTIVDRNETRRTAGVLRVRGGRVRSDCDRPPRVLGVWEEAPTRVHARVTASRVGGRFAASRVGGRFARGREFPENATKLVV